jgi:hypothetical protein
MKTLDRDMRQAACDSVVTRLVEQGLLSEDEAKRAVSPFAK